MIKRSTPVWLVMALLACAFVLSSCSISSSGKIVEAVTLPETYWISYAFIGSEDAEPELRYSEGLDKNGNIYINSEISGQRRTMIFLLQEDGSYAQYLYNKTDRCWESTGKTVSKNLVTTYQNGGLVPYANEGMNTYSRVKKIEQTTVAGRAATRYEGSITKDTVGATYKTRQTYIITVDDATGVCLENITTCIEKVGVSDGKQKDYYGTVCTRFETSGFDFAAILQTDEPQ